MKTVCNLLVVYLLSVPSLYAIDAAELMAEFEESRTKATNEYRGKEIEVSGPYTKKTKSGTADLITIGNAVNVAVRSRTEAAESLNDLRELIKAEKEREDKAEDWKKEFERKERRKTRGRKKYEDKLNPNGSTDFALKVDVTAVGMFKGIRSGKILLDPVTSIRFSGSKGAKVDPAGKPVIADLDREDWKLKGKLHHEFGRTYFVPDEGQYDLVIWSVDMNKTMKVGGKDVDMSQYAGKRLEIDMTCKMQPRGTGKAKPSGKPTIKSLKLIK